MRQKESTLKSLLIIVFVTGLLAVVSYAIDYEEQALQDKAEQVE